MFLTENKSIALFILVLASLCLAFYNIIHDHTKKPSVPVISQKKIEDDTSCHEKSEGDALPSAEDQNFSPPNNSIFFHETSCREGLTSRQACAVESVARAHPERKVYVLFSGPIPHHTLNSTRTSFYALRIYPNIEFARVHAKAYSKNTPIEALFHNEELRHSPWKITHTSDLLRVLTMFKFGGVYLDTDVIVLKTMDALGTNWVVRESDDTVNLAVMSVAKDKPGRGLMEEILKTVQHHHHPSVNPRLGIGYNLRDIMMAFPREISETYDPDIRNINGPDAVTRVMTTFCNTSVASEFSNKTCQGFKVYGPGVVYPVSYSSNKLLFTAGDMPALDQAYAVHLWNFFTNKLDVELGSPVETLAYQYCPIIYEMYDNSFGY